MKMMSALLAGWLFFVCLTAHSQPQAIVKIGHSAPLTGPQEMSGKDNDNGLRLAISDLNLQAIIVDGKQLRFVLDSEDDKSQPAAGVVAAEKIVDSKAVAVFGPYNSNVAIAASPIYHKAGIPMLTIAATPALTQQGFTNVFRLDVNSNQLASTLSRFAKQSLHAQTALIVDDRTAYGHPLSMAFAQHARATNIRIVDHLHLDANTLNYQPLLNALEEKKPDVVFFGGYALQSSLLIKEMRTHKIPTHLLLGDAACTQYMSKLAGKMATNVYCAQGNPALENSEAGRRFLARYKEVYKTDPLVDGVRLYDGMMMLAEAMKKANSTAPQKVIPQLAKMRYAGIAGVYEFDRQGDLKTTTSSLYTVKDGRLVLYRP